MKTKLTMMNKHGYIPMRRDIVRLLLRQVERPTIETLYVYLLINANYEYGETHDGRKLQRGDCTVDLDKLCDFYKRKRSCVYKALARLMDEGLIRRKEDDMSILHLNYYEEHCGWLAAPVKHRCSTPTASTPEVEEAFDEFFGFYHYMLHMPEAERERAHREWLRLTPEDRIHAFEGITPYTQSLRKPEHAKLACNYLKDKSFTTYL